MRKKFCIFLTAFMVCFAGFFTQAGMAQYISRQEAHDQYVEIRATQEQRNKFDKYKCSYENFKAEEGSCYFCPLFKTLFNVASELAKVAYVNLADGVANVVIVAFALWVSFFVLRNIASLEVKKPSKMIQEFLIQAFKVLIAVLILKTSYLQILRLTIEPVFNTGMNYVQAISDEQSCGEFKGLIGYKSVSDVKTAKGLLPLSVGQKLLCSIEKMQQKVDVMISYGKEIRCVAWHVKNTLFIPSFPYLITGDLMILAGLILLLAFPWCLVDCVLNLGVAAALIPPAIGAWPFAWTKQYIKKIFDIFLNAVFQFVFLGLILFVIMTIVDGFFSKILSHAKDFSTLDSILHPIDGLAFWGVKFMMLCMVCLLGWVFLEQAEELAGKFAKAPKLDIGRDTGGLFAQAADRVALGKKDEEGKRHGGLLGAGKAVRRVGKTAVKRFVGQPIRRAVSKKRNDYIKKHGKAIMDATGKITGYELSRRDLLGRKVTRRVLLGKNGKMTYQKDTKHLIGGGMTRVTKDNIMSVTQKMDKSGNIVSENYDFKTPMAKYLITPEGHIDKKILDQMVNESGVPKDMIYRAATVQMLEKRGMKVDRSFASRACSFKNGVVSFHQKNKDGSITNVSAEIKSNGQMFTSWKQIDKNGNKITINDNGFVRQKITQGAKDPDAKVFTSVSEYLAQNYRHTAFMTKNGVVGGGIITESTMTWGYNSSMKRYWQNQVNDNGRPQTI